MMYRMPGSKQNENRRAERSPAALARIARLSAPPAVLLAILLAGPAMPGAPFAVATPLTGTDDKNAAKVLERAILIQEVEGDFAVAIPLFRSIVDDSEATEKQKTIAWLHLAACYRALGKDDDADAALARAAAGTGEAAERAAALLSGSANPVERVRARVEALLRRPMNGGASVAAQQLRLIGEPAVPILLESLDPNAFETERWSDLLPTILEIGGEEAAEFVRRCARSDDEYIKRTILREYRSHSGPGIHEAIRLMLNDDSAAVRHHALEAASNCDPDFPASVLVPLVGDPDPEVREQARDAVKKLGLLNRPAFMEAIRPFLIQSIEKTPDQATMRLLEEQHILNTHAGREVYLHALGSANVPASANDRQWPVGVLMHTRTKTVAGTQVTERVFDNSRFESAPRSDDVLAVAMNVHHHLEPNGSGPRRTALRSFTHRCLDAWDRTDMRIVLALLDLDVLTAHSVVRWIMEKADDREGFEAVLRLLDQGVSSTDSKTTQWILKHAIPADAPTLIQSLGNLDNWNNKVTTWLRSQELPVSAFEPLRDRFEQIEENATFGSNPLEILRLIAKIPSDAAVPYLLDVARRAPDDYAAYIANRLSERDDDVARQALTDIARIEDCPRATRLAILQFLSTRNGTLVTQLASSAYRLGVTSDAGFGLLTSIVMTDASKLESGEERRIFEDVLSLGLADAWREVEHALGVRPDQNRLGPSFLAACCRHLPNFSTDDEPFRERVYQKLFKHLHTGVRGAVEFAIASLEDDTTGVRLDSIEWLLESHDDGPNREAALDAMRKLLRDPSSSARAAAFTVVLDRRLGAELAPAVRERLEDANADVRRSAMYALYGHGSKEPVAPLIAALDDPFADNRIAAALLLGRMRERSAVPALLDALRDPNGNVSQKAAESLDAIQEYHERIDRWTKWMNESELEGTSPAEALLAQARADNPSEIRVAATRSLGTLGVAETLPMLIRLMTDDDPEVAAAAREAVDRINDGDRPSKKTSDAKPSAKREQNEE